MSEDTDLGLIVISCDKFGGTRPAACCVRFDRYKACRRRCTSLKRLLERLPSFASSVEEHFAKRHKDAEQAGKELLETKSKLSGKNLPDPLLGCRYCDFIAKSARGLRVHMRRTHGKK